MATFLDYHVVCEHTSGMLFPPRYNVSVFAKFACSGLRYSSENGLNMAQFRGVFVAVFVGYFCAYATAKLDASDSLRLLGLTVATDETDGFKRFMRSATIHDIPIQVSGMHQKWQGGNMALYPGGGHKLILLRKDIEPLKNQTDLVVIFTDSYDVIFTAAPSEILKKFLAFKSRIVISAEGFVWPDKSLEDQYPIVKEGKRFLCSGGIIGYAPEIYKLMTIHPVKDTDDDQLYYTKLYLDEKIRNELQIKLDHKSVIFQNLNGAQAEVEIKTKADKMWLENTVYSTKPSVIHANGPTKLFLNYIGNYIPNGWNPVDGCVSCVENTFSLKNYQSGDYPNIVLAIFIEQLTPFMDEFLKRLVALEYPKNKVDLYIHNVEVFHNKLITKFYDDYGKSYHSVYYVEPWHEYSETRARNHAIEHCLAKHCKYLFVMDSDVVLNETRALKILIEQNRSIIAPKLSKHNKLWSNFWGDVASDGFYARSRDYVDIATNVQRGVWNVPYITSAYLAHISVLKQLRNPYSSKTLESDMAFCAALRSKGLFMYVDNMVTFGRLLKESHVETTRKHSDMYQIFSNKLDWEEKYLHPEYHKIQTPGWKIPQPCTDVFWVPLFSETFATHLWQECENFGEWSGGGHKDERISGGYENVPTVDIHMNQLGFEQHWLHYLKHYVAPIANYIFTGYYSEARATMNFVVKYNPKNQYFLRPHHDSSTYTINVALNRVGIDYEGGGARFTRYNCSVTNTKMGWGLMHPGRLTHQHEGLPTTRGTRYIMVCFIDP